MSSIRFEEITEQAGIAYIPGLTFGAAWGNFNQDPLPDLFVSNHFNSGSLYINNGDGTFTDIASDVFKTEDLDGDTHGAAWADFDNDGDQDLIQLVGAKEGEGSDPNRLYVNQNGIFEEQANTYGIDYPLLRGRTPLWLDFDNDGRLDIIMGGAEREDAPPTIFRQTDQGFEDARATTGFAPSNSRFSLLSDLSGDGNLDLVATGFLEGSSSRVTVYDLTSIPFENITSTAIRPNSDNDIAIADFNNDLRPDIYITRNQEDSANGFVDDWLFFNTEEGLIEQGEQAGINSIPHPGRSVVAGDFDNDMDVDIYIDGTTGKNQPNILLDNQGDGTFVTVSDAGGATGTDQGQGDSIVTADFDVDGFLDLFIVNQSAQDQLFRNQGNDNHWIEIDLEGVQSNRDGIGAQIFATAGGVTQLREQSGGIHRSAQNHQRIHFGLGDNTQVDELVIQWPSGVVQRLENIPANQLIQVIEPSDNFSPGQPTFVAGAESGVFLWKNTFDGPYHLRTIGANTPTSFEIDLIASDTLSEISPFDLEPNDTWETTQFGFSLNSRVINREDGVDFKLTTGTKALLSITQDGVPNPQQINVGGEGTPLSPAGWIINSEEFPVRPSFNTEEDSGLVVGQGETSDVLEFRWRGDENGNNVNLSVLTSNDSPRFSAIGFEENDQLTTLSNGVEIQGRIQSLEDGLDVVTPEPVQVGFTYQQDNLFQPDQVNSDDELLGIPNAYWVPLATPYGQPDYDSSEQEGLFLWQNENEQGLWHLRVTAGGENLSRYTGSISSNLGSELIQPVDLEPNDTLITTNPQQIDFDLRVRNSGEDGIDFRFPPGAGLMLNLEESQQESASLVRIGSEQWPILTLPVDLSGWA